LEWLPQKEICRYSTQIGINVTLPELPLVSIVIPAYNHAEFLDQSINSVLAQDYQFIELIVLDDGSTDNTRDILSEYDNRVYWESHENMGQALTLNKGWRMAKGSILAYLSADDILYPEAVERCVKVLLDNPRAALCYPDFDLINPSSDVIRSVSAPEYSYDEMVINFKCAPGVGAFFRQSCYKMAGEWNPELRQHPDYEYWLRLGLYGQFVHLKECLGGFRVHEESQSFRSVSAYRGDEPIRIIKSYLERADVPQRISNQSAIALSNASFMAAQTHLRSGLYATAMQRIYEAARYSTKPFYSSITPYKKIANGLVNKFAHRLLWKLKGIRRP
jgi:glycosyltransferase involved in cell wall biosynthesis